MSKSKVPECHPNASEGATVPCGDSVLGWNRVMAHSGASGCLPDAKGLKIFKRGWAVVDLGLARVTLRGTHSKQGYSWRSGEPEDQSPASFEPLLPVEFFQSSLLSGHRSGRDSLCGGSDESVILRTLRVSNSNLSEREDSDVVVRAEPWR